MQSGRVGRLPAAHRALALLVAGAMFMELLDGTIIATAAPRMARDFGVQSADIGVAITSYLLTVAVLIPLSGWLTDRFGARRIFVTAVVVFTLASAVCALSTNLLELTLVRVVQGVGGAMMVPVGRLVVLRSTTKDEVIAAIAYLTWPALFAPVLAPVLGGVLTSYASWRWIFLINVPLGVVGAVLAVRLVPDLRPVRSTPLDWVGLLTGTAGLGALVYGVSLVDGRRVPTVELVLLLGAAAVLLGLAVWHLLHTAQPLIDLRPLTIRTFRASQSGGSFYRIAILGVPFLLPLMFQDDFGWSPAKAGAMVVFVFIGNLCIKPATTPLLRRYGFRSVLVASIVLGAAATVACGWLRASTPLAVIGVLLIVGGAVRSIGFTGYNTIAFADVEAADMVHANTLSATLQQLAAGLSVAVSVLALRIGDALRGPLGHGGSVHFSFTLAFVALGLVLVPAAVDAVRLPRSAGATIGGGAGIRGTNMRKVSDIASERNTVSERPSEANPVPTIRVTAGTTAVAALQDAGTPLSGPGGAVVVRDAAGVLHDLDWTPEHDELVEAVTASSPQGLAVIRHSAAHVLAQAVQDLFPGTRLGIGPPIENGFYYDFDPARPFQPEDLAAVEKRMSEIIKDGQRFSRRPIEDDAARAELAHEPFKLELIGLKGGANEDEAAEVDGSPGAALTMYDNLDPSSGDRIWTDLCRGPHVPTTRRIPAFSITRSAAAYWRGSEKNPQLQRIYGTAWASRDDLKAYLNQLAEAAKRDHRKLGAELDLFSFPDELGSGLAVFHPKGGILRKEMEDYSRAKHIEAGYEFVNTPHITKGTLYEISGHLQWYADGMYPPMHLDEEVDAAGVVRKAGQDYYLKPMNCPMHCLIFRARGRSYRELPLRLFEFGSVYRYEKSGVIHGLTRVRGMTQDDAHIYCTIGQLRDELTSLLTFVLSLLRDYGLNDFYLELSTRNPEKSVGDDDIWELATRTLAEVAGESGLELVPDPGGAAFYGPKISVQARDAIGRTWQMSTIQLDFNMPARFELEYQANDGDRHRPVMIHRALFGSIERFVAVLTEHYGGAFPAWLSPVQVIAIPVTDDQVTYLYEVATRLKQRGIRVEVDDSAERMQKKIRTAQQQKVPFMLIAGGSDAESNAVSFRYRDATQRNGVLIEQAIDEIADFVARRANESPTADDF